MNARSATAVLLAMGALAVVITMGVPKVKPRETRRDQPPRQLERERVLPEDLVDGVWAPPDYPLRLSAPEGWTAVRRHGRPYLFRNPDAALEGNFNLLSLPNLFGRDLAGVLEESRSELTANGQFDLDWIGLVDLDGEQAMRADYRGSPRGGIEPVRVVCLVLLQGKRQVVLTVTMGESAYEQVWPAVEAAIGSIRTGGAPASAAAAPAAESP